MPSSKTITFKLDDSTAQTLDQLSAKQHIPKSALIRRLLDIGLEHELAKESADYIRKQIHDEIVLTCFPQFDRLAKLEAKVGYQSVSSFYLLTHIMDSILPASKQQDFGEIVKKSKAMAITYLQFNDKEFLNLAKSEAVSIEKLGLP